MEMRTSQHKQSDAFICEINGNVPEGAGQPARAFFRRLFFHVLVEHPPRVELESFQWIWSLISQSSSGQNRLQVETFSDTCSVG